MADIYAAERARRTAAIVRAEREIEAVAYEQYAKLLAAVASEVLRDKPPVVAAVDPEERLRRYWTEGAGAAKIRWGEDCDFCRCLHEVQNAIVKGGEKPMPPDELKGYCERLHVRATGTHPGGEDGDHHDKHPHCPNCSADLSLVAVSQDPSNPQQNQDQFNVLWLVLAGVITAKIAETFAARFLGSGAMRSRLAEAQRKFTDGVTERLRGVPDELFTHLEMIADDPSLSAAEKRKAFEDELLPGRVGYKERLSAVASRIGRTSGVAAFNSGDQAGFAEVARERSSGGAPHGITKSWLSSHDTKVRPTHAEADMDPRNSKIGVHELFHVGGFTAQTPGSWELPAHEAVNCRCTALYFEDGSLVASASEGPSMSLPNGFRGPIAALDVPTGDRRRLCTPEGGVKTRQYPLSLTMNHVGDPTGYPVIGHLDRVWVQNGLLYGEGPFDLGGEAGREAARQLDEGHMNTVSIDPDMVQASVNSYDDQGNLIDSDKLSHEEAEHFRLSKGQFDINQLRAFRGLAAVEEDGAAVVNYQLCFTDWRLAGLAMVPIPAYTEARIEPVYDYAPSEPTKADALVAAIGGQVFNSKFFGNPKFTEHTPLTIDEDGHVYGHVRQHGTCYQYGGGAGDGGFCLEPPESACGYAKFEQHRAKFDDGSFRWVGALTFGDGHYSAGSLKASQKQYNDIGTIAAKVNAGSDEFGIWINGEIVDEYRDKAYNLLLSPMSGHWEPDADNKGHLEMIAVHIVVTPGYTARKIVAGFDLDTQTHSLIIAFPPAKTPVVASITPEEVVPVSKASRAQVVAALADLAKAEKLLAKIGQNDAIVAAGGSMPIADPGTAWDGGGAGGRILDWASTDGKINVGKASRGFLAHVGDGSQRGDWKLPFADVHGGSLSIIPRGVSAAAGRLNQTQGIDQGAVKSKICGLYGRIRSKYPKWPTCPFDSNS